MNKKMLALISAAYLGTFMATLDISIVNVALPAIQQSLGVSMGGMQWIIDAYAVCLAAFLLAAGGLSCRFGMKLVWMLGIAGFVVSSFACSVADSLELLLLGRGLQGVFAALIIPGALSIIFHSIKDARSRSRIVGGWSACTAISLICGPWLGGIMVDTVGWEGIFILNIPIGAFTLFLGAWGIREFVAEERFPLDTAGQVLSVLFIGGMIYALIEAGGADGGLSPVVMATFSISIILLPVFFYVEKRAAQPLIPISLFKSSAFSLANCASFVLGFSYYSSLFFLSLFFQEAQGLTATQAGSRMVPAFAFTAIASVLFGRLTARFSGHKLFVAGYLLIGIAMSALGFSTATTPYWYTGFCLCLLGVGSGLAVPATSISVLNHADSDNLSIASSVMNALRQAGMAFGIAILGSTMNIASLFSAREKLSVAGVEDAALKAHSLMVGRSPIGQQEIDIYHTATAYGFNWAMFLAGGVCLAVGAVLAINGNRFRLN
ncbi:MFS transporter [Maridesulfovibrio sp.]|uniref:MFS transporter n=1 Tax=Maridesulfovibrio sp. TaxID=2795000 RepID=UPI0029F55E1C|nr:MFS transporter [Maridesulfovibrio sp.]